MSKKMMSKNYRETLKTAFEKKCQSLNLYNNDTNDLNRPYSTLISFVTKLYSLELGDKPLYAVVNRICREKDTELLD